MPKSEAYLDDCATPQRVRYPGFNDAVGGVRFVNGVALDPMPTRVLTRLLGIGIPLDVVGPWVDAPPQTMPPAVAPSLPQGASPLEAIEAPDDDVDAQRGRRWRGRGRP